jgi:hypothetical protein
LTSQPETVPSCYRRSRHAEFQPLSERHGKIPIVLFAADMTALKDQVDPLERYRLPETAGLPSRRFHEVISTIYRDLRDPKPDIRLPLGQSVRW